MLLVKVEEVNMEVQVSYNPGKAQANQGLRDWKIVQLGKKKYFTNLSL